MALPVRARLHVIVTCTAAQSAGAARAVRSVADQLAPSDRMTLLLSGGGELTEDVKRTIPWSGGRPCRVLGETVSLTSLPINDPWGFAARNVYGSAAAEDVDFVWHLRSSTIVRAGAVAAIKVALGDDRAKVHVFGTLARDCAMPRERVLRAGAVELVNAVTPAALTARTPFGVAESGDGAFFEALRRSGIVAEFHGEVVADIV